LGGRCNALENDFADAKAEVERRGELLKELTQYVELLEVRVRQVDEDYAAFRVQTEQDMDNLKVRPSKRKTPTLSRRMCSPRDGLRLGGSGETAA
jgi:hypothetical protein